MNFFPQYSQRVIIDRISFLASFASGVYCSPTSDCYSFLALYDKMARDYNEGNLWQQVLIKALCRVGV